MDTSTPQVVTPALSADFAQFGATVAPSKTAPADDAFAVWSENWTSVSTFLDCETQWNVVAGAKELIWLGLNYADVIAVLTLRKLPATVFDDLQTMERAALKAFADANR